MQNKDKLLDQIKNINQSVQNLNTQKAMISNEIKEIEFEEKKEKLKQAIAKSPVDWKTVLSVDEFELPLPGALEFVNEYIKEYVQNVKTKGHYNQSMQIGIHFLLNKNMNCENFILKMAPILKNLKPIIWNEKYNAEIAIPLIDKKNGTTGSYSLLINSQRLGRIVKVSGSKVEFKTQYVSLKNAFEWARKNCYYYG